MKAALEQAAGLVIVNYFLPNCIACRALHPKLMQLASANSEIMFIKVNHAIVNQSAVMPDSSYHNYRGPNAQAMVNYLMVEEILGMRATPSLPPRG